jgi:hypothetical protein
MSKKTCSAINSLLDSAGLCLRLHTSASAVNPLPLAVIAIGYPRLFAPKRWTARSGPALERVLLQLLLGLFALFGSFGRAARRLRFGLFPSCVALGFSLVLLGPALADYVIATG